MLYFDEVTYTIFDVDYLVTGFQASKLQDEVAGGRKRHQLVSVEFPDERPNTFIDVNFSVDVDGKYSALDGDVWIAGFGDFDVSTAGSSNPDFQAEVGQFIFKTGSNRTITLDTYSWSLIRMLFDNNSDNVIDQAIYFSSEHEIREATLSEGSLLPYEQVAFPPEAAKPVLLTAAPTTEDTIIVDEGHFSDDDTHTSKLSVRFLWRINEVELDEVQGKQLAAYTAKKGDVVSVVMRVTDDVQSTDSQPLEIIIADAPAKLAVTGVPDNLQPGEALSFTAMITDADEPEDIPANIRFGPAGLKIDERGQAAWQPENALFPDTSIFFEVVDDANSPSLSERFEVKVKSDDVEMPLLRTFPTGVIPREGLVIANVMGDGQKEVVVADTSHIFVYQREGDKYRQVWVYPYALPTDGRIVHIGATQADADIYAELVVVTTQGASLLRDLRSNAELIFSSEATIWRAATNPASGQRSARIAYIQDADLHTNGKLLAVRAIDSANDVLLQTMVGYTTDSLFFANVDNDPEVELVVSAGEVYDGENFSNQWFLMTGFAGSFVFPGDVDGDGISEILGVTSKEVNVYSAVTKGKIGSFEHSRPICAATAMNLDGDLGDELVLAECSIDIAAYDDISQNFSPLWSLNTGGVEISALASGDSDADGKPELHWGVGSYRDVDLEVAELNPLNILWSTNNELIPESFGAVGYTESSGEGATFFTAASTRDGDLELPSVIAIDREGVLNINQPGAAIMSNIGIATLNDVNSDGEKDLVYTGTGLSALRLDNFSQIFKGNSATSYFLIPGDFNSDGHDDFAYVSDFGTVNVFDSFNQSLIGSAPVGGVINSIAAIKNAGSDDFSLVVSATHKLTLWRVNRFGVALLDEKNNSCDNAEIVTIEENAPPVLVCTAGDIYTGYVSTFHIKPSGLEFSGFTELEGAPTATVVDSRLNKSNQLIIGVSVDNPAYTSGPVNFLAGLDVATGEITWKGPRLNFTVNKASLKIPDGDEPERPRLIFTAGDQYDTGGGDMFMIRR